MIAALRAELVAVRTEVRDVRALVDSLAEVRRRKELAENAAFAAKMEQQDAEVRAAAEAERAAKRAAILKRIKIETIEIAAPTDPNTTTLQVPFGGGQLTWPFAPRATLESKRIDELVARGSLAPLIERGMLVRREPSDVEIHNFLRERGG